MPTSVSTLVRRIGICLCSFFISVVVAAQAISTPTPSAPAAVPHLQVPEYLPALPLPAPGCGRAEVGPVRWVQLQQFVETIAADYLASRMGAWGNRGEVLLDMALDKDGKVARVHGVYASHPEFANLVLDRISALSATLTEQQRACMPQRMYLPFEFRLSGNDAVDAWQIKDTAGADLPPAYQFDKAPRLFSVIHPVYPLHLAREQATGEARVGMYINAVGEVVRVDVLSASHADFGLSLKAAVEAWRFFPARRAGKATPTYLAYTHRYELGRPGYLPSKRGLYALHPKTADALDMIQADKPDVVPVGALDQPPKLRYQAEFVYPSGGMEVQGKAVVTVAFYIDGEGRVQWPSVTQSVRPDIDWAALTAVSQWRFVPPSRKGAQVMTLMEANFSVGDE